MKSEWGFGSWRDTEKVLGSTACRCVKELLNEMEKVSLSIVMSSGHLRQGRRPLDTSRLGGLDAAMSQYVSCCFSEVFTAVVCSEWSGPLLYQLLHIVNIIPKSKELKASPLWTLRSPRIVTGVFGECDNGLKAFMSDCLKWLDTKTLGRRKRRSLCVVQALSPWGHSWRVSAGL